MSSVPCCHSTLFYDVLSQHDTLEFILVIKTGLEDLAAETQCSTLEAMVNTFSHSLWTRTAPWPQSPVITRGVEKNNAPPAWNESRVRSSEQ